MVLDHKTWTPIPYQIHHIVKYRENGTKGGRSIKGAGARAKGVLDTCLALN